MKKVESQVQPVNVVAFPADKMKAIVEALRPILDVEKSDHGLQTGCVRTDATGSNDWACSDAMV